MTKSFRVDIGRIERPKMTPQGYLKVDGFATRVGVFKYRRADGSIRRELRLPEEVFNADSLDSLKGIPVTKEHPPVPLNASNTKQYAVGFTRDTVEKVGDFLKVSMVITDKSAIEAVMDGSKEQLSCGYFCNQDETPGVHPIYGAYDSIQKNIDHNHLATVELGRAGPDARVKFDVADSDGVAVMVCDADDGTRKDKDWDEAYINNLPDSAFAFIEGGGDKDSDDKTVPRSKRHFPFKNAAGEVDLPHLRNALSRAPQSPFGDEAMKKLRAAAEASGVGGPEKKDSEKKDFMPFSHGNEKKKDAKGETNMKKIRIDGKEYEVDEGIAAIFQHKIDLADSSVAEAKKELETLKGKFDALEAESKKKDSEIDRLTKEGKNDQAAVKLAKSRLEVEAVAKMFLGDKENFDSVSTLDIKKRVLEKAYPENKIDSAASEDYVNGMFAMMLRSKGAKNDAAEKLDNQIGDVVAASSMNSDAGETKLHSFIRDAWKPNPQSKEVH